jgi:ABC-type multidrug transport system fused ATPase/permease subunit
MFSFIQARLERAFPALKDKLLWRLVRTNLHEQRKLYGISIAAMVVVAAMTSSVAWIMRYIVDAMTIPDNQGIVFIVALPMSNKNPPSKLALLAVSPMLFPADPACLEFSSIAFDAFSIALESTLAFWAIARSTAESCLAMASIAASVASVAALISSTG